MKLAPLVVVAALIACSSSAIARSPLPDFEACKEQDELGKEIALLQEEQQRAPEVFRARTLGLRVGCYSVSRFLDPDLARFAWRSGRVSLMDQQIREKNARDQEIVDLEQRYRTSLKEAERRDMERMLALEEAQQRDRGDSCARDFHCGTPEPRKRAPVIALLSGLVLAGLLAGAGVFAFARKLG